MHLHKFADMVSFEEIGIGGTFAETQQYRQFFKRLHPSQFLNSRIVVPIYEVSYSYLTKRGNIRRGKKYIFLRLEHEDLDVEIEMAFQDWVEELNASKPYRRISNADILEIRRIAYAHFNVSV